MEFKIQDKIVLKTAGKFVSEDILVSVPKPTQPSLDVEFDRKNGIVSANLTGIEAGSLKTYTSQERLEKNSPEYYSPDVTDQIILVKDMLLDRDHILKGDKNLKPEFIKEGVNLFGITGSYANENSLFITGNFDFYENKMIYTLSGSFFRNNYSLSEKTFSFPNCESIEKFQFDYSSLLSVNLPKLKEIPENSFSNTEAEMVLSFPNCSTVKSLAFYYSKLKEITLGSESIINGSIEKDAFKFCYNLSKITLGYGSVISLSSTAAFLSSPIYSKEGEIYVPANLVSAYKNETNWSVFGDIIKSIQT